MPFPHFRG